MRSTVLLCAVTVLLVAAVATAAPVINEVNVQAGVESPQAGQTSCDVEIFDQTGPADLSGFSVVTYDRNDQVIAALDLTQANNDGFLFVTVDCDAVIGAVGLYSAPAASFTVGDAVINTDLQDAIVWTDADNNVPAGLVNTLLNVGQSAINRNRDGPISLYESMQRCPNSQGGVRVTDPFFIHPVSVSSFNPCPAETLDVTINEVRVEFGTDNDVDVEVYDGGQGNTDLEGLTLAVADTNGMVLAHSTLDSNSQTNSDGLFSTSIADVDVTLGAVVALYTTPVTNGQTLTVDELQDAVIIFQGGQNPPIGNVAALLQQVPAQTPLQASSDATVIASSSFQVCKGGAVRTTTRYNLFGLSLGQPNPCPPIINEVDVNPADDNEEFVEILDLLQPRDLTGYSVVIYNSDGEVSSAVDMSTITFTGQYGLVLNSLTDSAGGVAIYQQATANFPVGAPATANGVLDAFVYETAATQAPQSLIDLLLSTSNPYTLSTNPYFSSNRCPNGLGGERQTESFKDSPPSPNGQNPCSDASDFRINEFVVDNSPSNQFVELISSKNTTNADRLAYIDGSGNIVDIVTFTDSLAGVPDGDGNFYYLVAVTTEFPGAVRDNTPVDFGTTYGALAYYSGDANLQLNQPPPVDSLIDAVVFTLDGTPPSAAVLALLNPGQSAVKVDSETDSQSRCPNGEGGPRNTDGWLEGSPTPLNANPCPAFDSRVRVNEIFRQPTGTGNTQPFFELFDNNAGGADSSLGGLVFVIYDQNGLATFVQDLSGFDTDMGYFTVGVVAGGNVPGIGIQLSDFPTTGGVAVYVGDAPNYPVGSGVTIDGLVDGIAYLPTGDLEENSPLRMLLLHDQDPLRLNTFAGQSGQRCPNGAGLARSTSGFILSAPTFESQNVCPTPFFINEVLPSDAAGWVEIMDGGRGGFSAAGLYVVVYTGEDSTINSVTQIPANTKSDNLGFLAIDVAVTQFCDSAAAVAIYESNVTPAPAVGDPVRLGDGLVDAIVYTCESGNAASDSLKSLLTNGNPVSASSNSIARCPNAAGNTRDSTAWVAEFQPTKATLNTCPSNGEMLLFNEVKEADAKNPNEFVELYDASFSGSLENVLFVIYDDALLISQIVDLTGNSFSDSSFYFVIGNTTNADLTLADAVPSQGAIALYDKAAVDDTKLAVGEGVYLPGLIDSFVVGIADDGLLLAGVHLNAFPEALSVARCGDSESQRDMTKFQTQLPTPGEDNECVPQALLNSGAYISEVVAGTPGEDNAPTSVEIRVDNGALNTWIAIFQADGQITAKIEANVGGPGFSNFATDLTACPCSGGVAIVADEPNVGDMITDGSYYDIMTWTASLDSDEQPSQMLAGEPVSLVGKALQGESYSMQRCTSNDCTSANPSVCGAGDAIRLKDNSQFIVRPATPATVNQCGFIINEFDINTEDGTSKQFVELFDGGIGGITQTVTLVTFPNSDVTNPTIVFRGSITSNADGYWTGGGSNVTPMPNAVISPIFTDLQAGGVALYTGEVASPVLTGAGLIDGIVYRKDGNSPAPGALEGVLQNGEAATLEGFLGDAEGQSLGRCANGLGEVQDPAQWRPTETSPMQDNECAIMINEVDADTTGPEDAQNEFIELFSGGAGLVSLQGYHVVIYDSEAEIVQQYDLNGKFAGPKATPYFILAEPSASGAVPVINKLNLDPGVLPNGPAAVALYYSLETDFEVDGFTTDDLVDALVYGTDDEPDPTLLQLLNPGQRQVNEGPNKQQTSMGRCLNGFGGLRNTDSYRISGIDQTTMYAANDCPVQVTINEVAGATDSQFVELFDGGTGGYSLNELTLVFQNTTDHITAIVALSGFFTRDSGYFVVGTGATDPVGDISISSLTFSKEGGTVSLFQEPAGSFTLGSTALPGGALEQVTYAADNAPNSRQRCPNGQGTFALFAPTNGEENECPFNVLINEFNALNADYYVELTNPNQRNLAGLVMVLFKSEANSGNVPTVYSIIDLDDLTTERVVVGAAGVPNLNKQTDTAFVNNVPAAIALYDENASFFSIGDEIPTDIDPVDAVVYDNNQADDPELLVLLKDGQTSLNLLGLNDDTLSLGRCPDNAGGARTTSFYISGTKTPGAANECEDDTLRLTEIEPFSPGHQDRQFIELYSRRGKISLTGYQVGYYGSTGSLQSSWNLGTEETTDEGFFVIGSKFVSPPPQMVIDNAVLDGTSDGCILLYKGSAPVANLPAAFATGSVDAICWKPEGGANNNNNLRDQVVTTGTPGDFPETSADRLDSIAKCAFGSVTPRDTDLWRGDQADTPGRVNTCSARTGTAGLRINEVGLYNVHDSGRTRVEIARPNGGACADGDVSVVYFSHDSLFPLAVDTVTIDCGGDEYYTVDFDSADVPARSGAVALYDFNGWNGNMKADISTIIDAVVFNYDRVDVSALEQILLIPGQKALSADDSLNHNGDSMQRCPDLRTANSNSQSTDVFYLFKPTFDGENGCRRALWTVATGAQIYPQPKDDSLAVLWAACDFNLNARTLECGFRFIRDFDGKVTLHLGDSKADTSVLYEYDNGGNPFNDDQSYGTTFDLVEYPRNLDGFPLQDQLRGLLSEKMYFQLSDRSARGALLGGSEVRSYVNSMDGTKYTGAEDKDFVTTGSGGCYWFGPSGGDGLTLVRCDIDQTNDDLNEGELVFPGGNTLDFGAPTDASDYRRYDLNLDGSADNSAIREAVDLMAGVLRMRLETDGADPVGIEGAISSAQAPYIISGFVNGLGTVPPVQTSAAATSSCFVEIHNLFFSCSGYYGESLSLNSAQLREIQRATPSGVLFREFNNPDKPTFEDEFQADDNPLGDTTKDARLLANNGIFTRIDVAGKIISGTLHQDVTYSFSAPLENDVGEDGAVTLANAIGGIKCVLYSGQRLLGCQVEHNVDGVTDAYLVFTYENTNFFIDFTVATDKPGFYEEFFLVPILDEDENQVLTVDQQVTLLMAGEVLAEITTSQFPDGVINGELVSGQEPNLSANCPMCQWLGGRPLPKNSVFRRSLELLPPYQQRRDVDR